MVSIHNGLNPSVLNYKMVISISVHIYTHMIHSVAHMAIIIGYRGWLGKQVQSKT